MFVFSHIADVAKMTGSAFGVMMIPGVLLSS